MQPRELMPRTVTEIPQAQYFNASDEPLPADAPINRVAKVIYTFHLKEGIYFQDHPCFAKNSDGSYRYHHLTYEDIAGFYSISDFKHTGTRELTADDYIYGLYRAADPRTNCPIISTLKRYIRGLKQLNQQLDAKLKQIRMDRREAAGAFYNQERDEREHPIVFDRMQFACEGIIKHDRYTFSIVLNEKYPPFLYWLCLYFVTPIPWEAELFYDQGPMIQQNIVLSRFPVGTGPFYLEKLDPNLELILRRNPHFNHLKYPIKGKPEDYTNGMLKDAGKPIPFIERAIFKLEKEPTTRWGKFLMGYYDQSGVGEEDFDRVVQVGREGFGSSDFIETMNIRLKSAPTLSLLYYKWNMQDPVWGGLEEPKCKMRQAVSIALNMEERIMIFNNGMAHVAQHPVPPDVVGYVGGKETYNSYTHNWNEEKGIPIRKTIQEAKTLLAEAGYPNGIDSQGKQLILYFDNASNTSSSSEVVWVRKKLEVLNIQVVSRTTDWGRLIDKFKEGTYQFTFYGWGADYPDAENFLFLFECPHYTKDYNDSNYACNDLRYNNPEYNRLFYRVRSMEPSPERQALIVQCIKILQHDAPWVFGWVPYGFSLSHEWVTNETADRGISLEYMRLDTNLRIKRIMEWNQPIYWPFILLFIVLVLLITPVVIAFRLREQGKI